MNDSTFELIATCAFGLEAIVRRELEGLGYEAKIESSGRVVFQGDWTAIAKANLWLRTADRVLIRVARFFAADFDALYENTRHLNWAQHLPADASFPVTGRSIKSTLSSVPACQRSVKKAIVEALLRDHSATTLPESGAEFKVDVALLDDVVSLTIDTTGRSLHRRGYRTHISSAPLKETLASAMVMLSYWKRDRPLLDPFCGSGTIAIEAARIGRNLAPGLDRDFACQAWPQFPSDQMQTLRDQARREALPALEERIVGTDIDAGVLRAARENAERANVAEDIHFEPRSFDQLSSRRRFGCLIANPPYGERISAWGDERRDLDRLYESMPEVLSRLPTWSHYILTAYRGFESTLGRQADRRRKLYNGRIECTYYQFHGPKPVTTPAPMQETDQSAKESPEASAVSVKPYVHALGPAAFGQLDAKADEQAELFQRRLVKRARHLRRWPTRRGITCYRLYERDVPEIPLVVDRYEDHLHLTEYERPHERTPAQHAKWLQKMADAAAEVLDVPKQNVFLKTRQRQRGTRQHERLSDLAALVTVQEGGLKFQVNLSDYVDTGLFLDHRLTRQMAHDLAAGKRFLNLFAYTGAFTVYAAAGGAEQTTSVDLSRNYLDWARQNMKLNGFTGPEHGYHVGDVTQFVRQHTPGQHYDLVVLDPPTFSNSKRTELDWEVQRDAIPLLNDLMPLVKDGG
ncbi:MAG: bifunctional 23S rRNA (guanine(2069)-N(7))-methyltransferase RlmK/23S rRNA (guanine(2445)-N(2))-methyltransferase RlmL, partial [Planctomycetota bacterium]